MITAVIKREWKELYQSPALSLGVLIVPIALLVVGAIVILNLEEGSKFETIADILKMVNPLLLLADDGGQALLARFYFMTFLLVPGILPLTFATTSIISEKMTGSLESVLVTPLSTFKLLFGKILAYAIPPVIVTWIAQVIFLLIVVLRLPDTGEYFPISWILCMFLLVPSISIISVGLAVIVSSRVSSINSAQQISLVIVLPVLGLAFGQVFFVGLMSSVWVNIGLLLVSILLSLLVIRSSVLLFNRETIISSWK